MFEQELYKSETTQVESQSGDLFHNYEIKNWVVSRTLYTILAISAVLNFTAIAFIGQTDFLTRRGCDSPFVGRVCQVLDMAYVGTILLGTEREYADAVYEKSELADADITYIDVSSETPPLSYPEGYFQIANPVQYARLQQQMANPTNAAGVTIPGFPMSSTSDSTRDLLKIRPNPPAPNPNAFQDNGDTSLFKQNENNSSPSARKGRRGGRPVSPDSSDGVAAGNPKNGNANTASPIPTPTPDSATVVANAEEAKADQNGVFINKRPLKDYAKTALANIDNKTVLLDKPVKVVIAGTLGLGKDGKTIVLKDPIPVRAKTDPVNDPAMEKFVQDAILAVGDAGWFGYLDRFKVKKVVITIEQNDTNLVASVRSDQPSENYAKQVASGLNATIALGASLAKGDEQTFLKLAKTTSEGKTFILNFEIPKPLVQELVLRKLAESKEKENKPNSTALVAPNNKNTSEK